MHPRGGEHFSPCVTQVRRVVAHPPGGRILKYGPPFWGVNLQRVGRDLILGFCMVLPVEIRCPECVLTIQLAFSGE